MKNNKNKISTPTSVDDFISKYKKGDNLEYIVDNSYIPADLSKILDHLSEHEDVVNVIGQCVDKRMEIFGIETPNPGTEKEWYRSYKEWGDLENKVRFLQKK